MSRPGPFSYAIDDLEITYGMGLDNGLTPDHPKMQSILNSVAVLKAAGKEKIVWDKKTGLLKFTNGYPDELICAIHEAQEASREK